MRRTIAHAVACFFVGVIGAGLVGVVLALLIWAGVATGRTDATAIAGAALLPLYAVVIASQAVAGGAVAGLATLVTAFVFPVSAGGRRPLLAAAVAGALGAALGFPLVYWSAPFADAFPHGIDIAGALWWVGVTLLGALAYWLLARLMVRRAPADSVVSAADLERLTVSR